MDIPAKIIEILNVVFISGPFSGESRVIFLVVSSFFCGHLSSYYNCPWTFALLIVPYFSFIMMNNIASGEYFLIIFFAVVFFCCTIIGIFIGSLTARKKVEKILSGASVYCPENGKKKIFIEWITDFEVRLLLSFLYYETYNGSEKELFPLKHFLHSKKQDIKTGKNHVEWPVNPIDFPESRNDKDAYQKLFLRDSWLFSGDCEVIEIEDGKFALRL